jgi:hypothetical protein
MRLSLKENPLSADLLLLNLVCTEPLPKLYLLQLLLITVLCKHLTFNGSSLLFARIALVYYLAGQVCPPRTKTILGKLMQFCR